MGRKRVERKPHFFKVLLGDFAFRLKVPPQFLKHISNEASKIATLEGPNGCSWPVEIKMSSEGTFLSTGWFKFVEDHSLKEREFLVFRYNGNMHFNVQVFDTTACEREDLFAIQRYKKPKVNQGGSRRGRPRKKFPNVDCEIEHKEIKCESLEILALDNRDAEYFQIDYVNSVEGSCVTSQSPTMDPKSNIKVEKLPFPLLGSETTDDRVYFQRRWSATPEEMSQAWEAATSFSYDFPCAVIRMTVSSVHKGYMMRLPVTFSRRHLPRESINMSLTDPSGKSWTVIYAPGRKDRRDRLSNGWPAFCRGNSLKDGDICAFELTGPNEIKVHIFREANN